jgi:hypothetical protein
MTLQTPSNAIFQTPFKRFQTQAAFAASRALTPFKRPSNAKLHIRPSNALHTPSPSECRRASDGLSTHPPYPLACERAFRALTPSGGASLSGRRKRV